MHSDGVRTYNVFYSKTRAKVGMFGNEGKNNASFYTKLRKKIERSKFVEGKSLRYKWEYCKVWKKSCIFALQSEIKVY